MTFRESDVRTWGRRSWSPPVTLYPIHVVARELCHHVGEMLGLIARCPMSLYAE